MIPTYFLYDWQRQEDLGDEGFTSYSQALELLRGKTSDDWTLWRATPGRVQLVAWNALTPQGRITEILHGPAPEQVQGGGDSDHPPLQPPGA